MRPDLAGLEPYTSPQIPARYRMNTNESPYEPTEALAAELAGALAGVDLNRYPDRDASGLIEGLSRYLGWPGDGVWAANGSNEVLLHLCLAYGGPGRTVMTFEPTYSLHSVIARVTGARVVQLGRSDDFQIDLDGAVAAIREHRPEIVMVCSPNNPTGGCEPLSIVEVLLEEAPGVVIVDEAYVEFAGESQSVRRFLPDHPGLVVTRTFSKAWRLAGARIGYLLSSPSLVAGLMLVRLPYHLSSVTQVIGEIALQHTDEIFEHTRLVAEERDRISMELQIMGLKTHPSDANFVLFEVENPDEVWHGLLQRDVLVRNYSSVSLLRNCLRVTAGTPVETSAFLDALDEVLDD
jgi:histidinol-phosphate aminotransferase